MDSGSVNILVVDDELAVAVAIRMALKSPAYHVDVLHTGEQALAKLKESPDYYHILITDHVMPEVTGIQLLQQLKATAFKGRIIVLSAYVDDELEKQYQFLGASRNIKKPFDLDELRRVVGELAPKP